MRSKQRILSSSGPVFFDLLSEVVPLPLITIESGLLLILITYGKSLDNIYFDYDILTTGLCGMNENSNFSEVVAQDKKEICHNSAFKRDE